MKEVSEKALIREMDAEDVLESYNYYRDIMNKGYEYPSPYGVTEWLNAVKIMPFIKTQYLQLTGNPLF